MSILTVFLDIFFVPYCISCKREGKYLCDECAKSTAPALISYPQDICFFRYLDEDWMHQAVHLLKYQGITSIFDEFLRARKEVAEAWFHAQSWCFVPVPSSRKRLKQRGYNQAEIIARKMAFFWGGEVAAQCLRKYDRKSLVGRSRQERQAQASTQFYWGGGVLPEADLYVVVDDVLTTGSTLRACMELVQIYADRRVVGLAVAHER